MIVDERQKEVRETVSRYISADAFTYLIGEVYARRGASVHILEKTQSRGYDVILDDSPFTPRNTDDVTAVNCKQISTKDEIGFDWFEQDLRQELVDEFNYYIACTTAEQLTTLARQKLASREYPDNWFTFQNIDFILEYLLFPYSSYLPFLYDEVVPSAYSDGWTDRDYLRDRFAFLGVSVDEKIFQKVQASDSPLLFVEHIEKFAIIESFAIPSSIYDFMQYDGHRKPKMLDSVLRRVNVEDTTPNEEIFSKEACEKMR